MEEKKVTYVWSEEENDDLTQFSVEVEHLKNFCKIVNHDVWAMLIHGERDQYEAAHERIACLTEELEVMAVRLDRRIENDILRHGLQTVQEKGEQIEEKK